MVLGSLSLPDLTRGPEATVPSGALGSGVDRGAPGASGCCSALRPPGGRGTQAWGCFRSSEPGQPPPATGHVRRGGREVGGGRPGFSPAAWMTLGPLPQPPLESSLHLSRTLWVWTSAEAQGWGISRQPTARLPCT